MKKSKFFLSCLAGLLGLTTLVLTGCTGCSDGTDSGGGGDIGGGDGGGGTDNPNPPEPTKSYQDMDGFFNGVRINSKVNVLIDENNVSKTFEELLDRQIDILAQDVLFRLQVVYGNNNFSDKKLSYNSNSFINNGNEAKITIENLLTKDMAHFQNAHITENIDCIYCYQEFINNLSNEKFDSSLNKLAIIKLTSAINGRYMSYNNRNAELLNDIIEDKQWQFSEESKYATDYINEVKMAIAQILTGSTNNFYSFEQSSYDALLSKINTLGYNSAFKDNLVNYINNNVIGTELYNENLAIYNKFSESEKGDLWNWRDEENIDKHYYKGYNIVVPAIVDMALNNTFDGTTSLYPTVSRVANEKVSLTDLNSIGNYSNAVLMPSKSLTATKIKISLRGDLASVGKTVNIKAEIYGNNTQAMSLKNVGNLSLTSSNQTIELTFNNSTVNSYSGSKEFFGATQLFGSNPEFVERKVYGGNYIKLIFETEANFAISFDKIWQ